MNQISERSVICYVSVCLFTCILLFNHFFLSLVLEFIEGVSQFSVKGDKESKLKCKYTCR